MAEPAPKLTIRLNPADNIVIARADLLPGTAIPGENVAARTRIPSGHKIATHAIAKDQTVRRYGQIIGFATSDIAPGDHVHTQNCEIRDFARDYAYCQFAKPTDYVNNPATFQGYVREDGRVATRNFIGVLTSVELLRHRRALYRRSVQDQPLHRPGPARRLSQCRRRRGAHPQDRLRHGERGRRHGPAAPGHRRLCPPPEFRGRAGRRPRLRGGPDRRHHARA